MATEDKKLVLIESLSKSVLRIKQEYTKAISEAERLKMEESEAVPEPSAAVKDVLYFVKGNGADVYEVYTLIGDKVVSVGISKDSLSGYVTTEQLKEAISGIQGGGAVGGSGTIYEGVKTSHDATDMSVIDEFFTGDDKPKPAKGDVFIVNTDIEDVSFNKSSYYYNGAEWIAMAGNVDAERVILHGTISLAGDYTQIGNWVKDINGTIMKDVNGKSIMDVLKDITTKVLQPTITSNPSISGFSLSGAKAVEAGTKLSSVDYTAATLNPGSYKYGPDTGVNANKWKVERVTDKETVEITTAAAGSLGAGSDDNGGKGFVIGDMEEEGVVSSLKYRVTVDYDDGVTAHDNLGGESSPPVMIQAGSKKMESSAYTAFRNYFYGTSEDKPELNSEYIRSLTPSGKAYSEGELTVQVPAGTKRIAIACINDVTGVVSIINKTALSADVTETFTMSTVQVEGADGYSAKDYNVWVYEPALPFENSATFIVKLG